MALGGEIASLFIRIRPNLQGFAAETTEGVKAALAEVQEQVTAYANEQIEQTAAMVRANMEVASSYKEIGDAAQAGSTEQKVAYGLAVSSAQAAAALMVDASDEVIAGTLRQIDENKLLAGSFTEGAVAAKDAALVQIGAIKEAGDAAQVGAKKIGSSYAMAAEEGDGAFATLKSHLLSFGTLLGVGIGADFAVKLTKDVTNSAATIQKSQEVVRDEFGQSSSVISKFVSSTAEGLNISNTAAESTASQFGILFKNLQIGGPAAAQMTVGWEKLVGAISQLRGVDPTTILSNITKAAAGNTRGLKQLGIVVTTATLEAEAFKLHLTETTTQALSPAQKAIATYALATSHLGEFQQQAAAHANDYANVQLRLSAAWANAKDTIGEGLLPTFTKYVGELSSWLGNLNKSGDLQKDVNSDLSKAGAIFEQVKNAITDVIDPLKTMVGWMGGAKDAAEDLLGVLAVSKIVAIANAIKTQLVEQGMQSLATEAGVARTAYVTDMGEMEVATIGLGATIKSALISTGIGAIVVAVGIATALIIQHWNTVKSWLQEFGQWIEQNAEDFLAIPFIGSAIFMAIEVIKHFQAIKDWVVKFAGDLKEIFVHPIKGIEDTFRDLASAVEGIFTAIGKSILLTFAGIIDKVLALIAKIPTKISAFGVTLGGTNPAIGLKKDFDAYIAGLKLAEANAKSAGSSAADQFAGSFGSAGSVSTVTDAAKKVGKKVADAVVAGATGDGTGNTLAAQQMAEKLADSIFSKTIDDSIKAAKTKLADALSSNNQKIADAQQSLGNYIVSGTQRIQKAVTDNNTSLVKLGTEADTNLTSIAKKLATDAGDLIQKNIDLGTLPANAALNTALTRLQTDLLSGKATGNLALLTQQAQALTSQVDVKGNSATLKQNVEEHIQGLVAAAQHGKISVKNLMTDLTSYLKGQGLTFKAAGKLLGSSFADGMQADLDGIKKQFAQIGLLPKSIRTAASSASQAGQGPKIVDIKTEMEKLRSSLDTLRATYKTTLNQKIQKFEVTTKDADKAIAQARVHATQTYQTDALRVAEHHYQESVKQTALLQKIASSNAALAAISTNTSGFKTSTTTNPGKSSHDARAAARRGVS